MEGKLELSKEETERLEKQEAATLESQQAEKTADKPEWAAIADKSYQMFLNYDANPNWKLFS